MKLYGLLHHQRLVKMNASSKMSHQNCHYNDVVSSNRFFLYAKKFLLIRKGRCRKKHFKFDLQKFFFNATWINR